MICGRHADPLEETVREIWQDDGGGIAVQADVSVAEDVERLVERALHQYGVIDILINNAGIGNGQPIRQHSGKLGPDPGSQSRAAHF